MHRRLDIVLFGASGFTGRRCIRELHRLTKSDGRSLRWGVAGRSEKDLQDILREYQNQTGVHLNFVPIIVADVEDETSLKNMTAQTRILINCCGPYRFLGERVIKACLETQTHQVDVSGEPEYMETIQLKYHRAARERGVYIVSSCGFDSIPADLGVIFLQKNFKGTLNSVETYMGGHIPPLPGPSFNYATWESAIHGIANADQLYEVRRKLYSKQLPKFKPKLKPRQLFCVSPINSNGCNLLYRSLYRKIDVINGWPVPFLGADRSVIQRSQRYLYEHENIRPAHVQTYQAVETPVGLFWRHLYGALFLFMVRYNFGRNLLLKYPEFFSGGVFSHQAPSDEKLSKTAVYLMLHGKGWDKTVHKVGDESNIPPNKSMMGYIGGINPAYGITCYAVTLAAITILTEADKLPERGGVYTPGVAFAETSLINQLQRNGLTFEIRSKL